jgi:hypothetical protein
MMSSAPALRRFPRERVLLARTKLAYVHLRNLLTDAKRDRTARVSGYVVIWQPEEALLLFLQEGEPVNAIVIEGEQAHPVAIADALSRVPSEPEFGEVLFHAAPEEQLACMFRALLRPPVPWPEDVSPADPRSLLPSLREERFEGVLEVAVGDAANYLVLRDGLIDKTYLVDDDGADRASQLARLFNGNGSSRPVVRRWRGAPALPLQAPPQLVDAYCELIVRLGAELAEAGIADATALVESARVRAADEHPVLAHLGPGAGRARPVTDRKTLTAAMTAWTIAIAETAWPDAPGEVARHVASAGRERRQMFTAAGFAGALPWPVW